jgi:cobalt-zinc-cadmium efflux system membrane fusion protein
MKRLILSLSLLTLCACGNRSGDGQDGGRLYTLERDHIVVPEDSPALQHIRIQKIEAADYRAAFSTSGTVRAIPSRYAGIATPFAGRIVKSFVRLGQKVSAGSPVFEISSPSFLETGRACHQAKQEMELALKSLNRTRDLLANHVAAAKDVEEAEVNYELRKKEYENLLAALRVYRIEPDEPASGQPLTVRSPIAGEIVKDEIVIGQYVREDADALAVVADLDKVWVVARVKEKDIPLLQDIAGVGISLTSLPDTLLSGSIYHVGKLLDEETHSVEVIIECDNREHRIKPFMYGTVRFTGHPVRAITVPNSAVLQDEDSCYVLISEGRNRFRRSNLTIAPAGGEQTVVLAGIGEGDTIITEGAFYFIEAR